VTLGKMEIAGGLFQIVMAQQNLNSVQVSAGLERCTILAAICSVRFLRGSRRAKYGRGGFRFGLTTVPSA
jgi:hypothetical protein